jgi:cell shape-determining protein MreC
MWEGCGMIINIIGVYCLIIAILQALVLMFATENKNELAKIRRVLIWISNPLFLFVAAYCFK